MDCTARIQWRVYIVSDAIIANICYAYGLRDTPQKGLGWYGQVGKDIFS
jgi:hypothetical protein